ncbi:hypothetical protein P7C73_g4504, partial [Tremellales sp. Uapishka_1]
MPSYDKYHQVFERPAWMFDPFHYPGRSKDIARAALRGLDYKPNPNAIIGFHIPLTPPSPPVDASVTSMDLPSSPTTPPSSPTLAPSSPIVPPSPPMIRPSVVYRPPNRIVDIGHGAATISGHPTIIPSPVILGAPLHLAPPASISSSPAPPSLPSARTSFATAECYWDLQRFISDVADKHRIRKNTFINLHRSSLWRKLKLAMEDRAGVLEARRQAKEFQRANSEGVNSLVTWADSESALVESSVYAAAAEEGPLSIHLGDSISLETDSATYVDSSPQTSPSTRFDEMKTPSSNRHRPSRFIRHPLLAYSNVDPLHAGYVLRNPPY